MNRLNIVTFLSDFGWSGGYVAACEATVARIQPHARVFHISHEVDLGDIAAGAMTLERLAPLFPVAVHLAVIDPGVGTGRWPLALTTARGDALVGPDNGLLLAAADALGGLSAAWLLDPERVRAQAGLPVGWVSSTFHGRDVFAPAAALLSASVDPRTIGSSLDSSALVRLALPKAEVTGEGAVAEVIEVDRFGNVGLALRFADFSPGRGAFTVEIVGEDPPEWNARVVQTYGELRPGELGIFCDSWGHVALALNGASAAQLLSVDRGRTLRLAIVPGSSSTERLA
jgi:S-adenosyl-L-methionine hydrolase (adenosine-forming)